jgi:hypothetical protein
MNATTNTTEGRTSRDSAPSSAEVRAALATLGIPPIEVPTKVAIVVAHCARIVQDRNATRELAYRLREEDLPNAREADKLAYAATIAASEPDPDPVHTIAVQTQLAEADRRSEALEVAELTVRKELVDAIRDATTAWRARLDADVAKAHSAYTATIDPVRDAHAKLIAAQAARTWLDDPTRPLGPQWLTWMPTMTNEHGHPLMVVDLLAQLHDLADPRT